MNTLALDNTNLNEISTNEMKKIDGGFDWGGCASPYFSQKKASDSLSYW